MGDDINKIKLKKNIYWKCSKIKYSASKYDKISEYKTFNLEDIVIVRFCGIMGLASDLFMDCRR